MRVFDDCRGCVVAGQNHSLGAKVLRQLHGRENALALPRRQPLQLRRLDVRCRPFDGELVGEPRRASDHMLASRVRPHATKQRCLGFPDALDRLVGAIRLDVVFDAIGRAAQRKLAQRHEIALAEEISGGALDLLGHVDLARLEARQQFVRRNVDQDHIVGLVEECIGNGFPNPDAGDGADDVVQALQMLDVERRVHIDAARQKFVDVLPALRMPRARCVGVGKLVDENQSRAPNERGVEIEFPDRCARDIEHQWRQWLETLEQCGCFGAAMRFEYTDHDVAAGATQRLGGDQHRIGLADSGRGAEEYLQPAPGRAGLPRLYGGEKLIGVRTLFRHALSLTVVGHFGYWRSRAIGPEMPYGMSRPISRSSCRKSVSRRWAIAPPIHFATRSSAMLSLRTLTRGSPSTPSVRPSVFPATRRRTSSAARPRAFATRASW